MDYRDEYQGKTILITGGAGCIGSNLTKALIDLGIAKVIIVDDLSASCEWNVPKHPSVEFIKGSIMDDKILAPVFGRGIDIVFHLAAHFANQHSIDYPELDLDVNGLGTLRVLDYSLDFEVKRAVYASSGCSVYGSQAPLPLKEDFVSIHLDTPYQIHKLLGELYCNFYYDYYKLPVTIARYFNVYGEGEVPGSYRNVIPNFVWKAMHSKPLEITGNGEETRDFTYVGDIVDGTLRLGVMDAVVGEAFNLASGVETQIIDIAETINSITGNKSQILYTQRRDWDKITKRCASIDKANYMLGFEPKTDIRDGIKAVYKWMFANKSAIEEYEKELGL